MTIKITSENYEQEVLKSDIPVLLDFWAGWCGPCRMIAPVLEEISQELQGKVKVGKVDVDAETELSRKFNVMSIPALAVVKDGKVVKSSVGFQPKDKILEMLK